MTYLRLSDALGLRLTWHLPVVTTTLETEDAVHAVMGEVQARRFGTGSRRVLIDEPYQRFRFAGRGDLVVVDRERRAVHHSENKTRIVNVGELGGSFNAKCLWLPGHVAGRMGIRRFASETHTLVLLWSEEVLAAARSLGRTLHALGPDATKPFAAWWDGTPLPGVHRCVVVFDPIDRASSQPPWVGLDEALSMRPRYRGDAVVVEPMIKEAPALGSRTALPEQGASAAEIEARFDALAVHDLTDWEARLMAGGTYPAGDEVLEVAKAAYLRFFSTNPLYASTVFPSLTAMEREIVAMTADLLHAPDGQGSVTSGGSESILMGIKIARDRARQLHPEITEPEMVVPLSAHPAFWKGAHYFGLKLVRAPLRDDFQLDVEAYQRLITPDTVLLVGSAPSLTIGMVDPIEQLAPMALERGISFHVDSCVGGYFLPFAEQIGRPIPRFDFRVPGVTTISADLHKFGYAAKGASCIISRDADIFRHQGFRFGAPERPDDWYVTPSMTGTRPGGAIAAAWAVLNHLGVDGYRRLTAQAMAYMDRFWAGINAIEGLHVLGTPAMTLFGYASDTLDIFAIAKGLTERGWLVFPDEWPVRTIRFMQSPGHEPYIDRYLADLREVAELVRSGQLVADGGRAQYT